MPRDPFAVLGLAPGRYSPTEIERRYQSARKPLVARLVNDENGWPIRRSLDDLHWAYRTLINPENQVRATRMLNGEGDKTESLRLYIEASLEEGLLRASRRQEILELGKALGISEFHTHLLIAQTQFGEVELRPPVCVAAEEAGRSAISAGRPLTYRVQPRSLGLRAVSALALAGAMFCVMMQWIG